MKSSHVNYSVRFAVPNRKLQYVHLTISALLASMAAAQFNGSQVMAPDGYAGQSQVQDQSAADYYFKYEYSKNGKRADFILVIKGGMIEYINKQSKTRIVKKIKEEEIQALFSDISRLTGFHALKKDSKANHSGPWVPSLMIRWKNLDISFFAQKKPIAEDVHKCINKRIRTWILPGGKMKGGK